MSRAVKEDISGLPFKERFSRRLDGFKEWVYNAEAGTYLGDRRPNQWGALCLYYLLFYGFLAAFTAIFFGILGGTLPARPSYDDRGSCSNAANARYPCGPGPFYQASNLYDDKGPGSNHHTDDILAFSVCEPAFSSIPREIALGVEPDLKLVSDSSRVGYNYLISEINRVLCVDESKKTVDSVGTCDKEIRDNFFPLIPKSPDSFYKPSEMLDLVEILGKEKEYEKPLPLYKFAVEKKTYEVYIVFFKFNKVWNFQPYDQEKANGLEQIVNNIGLSCAFEEEKDQCKGDTTAINYRGEAVQCGDNTKDKIWQDGSIHFELLSNVMSNSDGFPWRGGDLNMNYGSMAITKELRAKDNSSFNLECKMGGAIPRNEGVSYVGPEAQRYFVEAKEVKNFDKQHFIRSISSSSDGDTLLVRVAH